MAYSNRDFNPSNNPIVDGIKGRVDDLMRYIEENCPENRQRSIALTNIEQGSMWAVKSKMSRLRVTP